MINAIRLYRMANKLYNAKVPLIPKIIKLLIFLIYNSSIPYECDIGLGSIFGYSGISVVIHKKVTIGENCVISQGVTIGGKQGSDGVPVIGNNVHIGAGAKILGNVIIGDNCIIGANAVVIRDLPNNAVAVGVPARIIRYVE